MFELIKNAELPVVYRKYNVYPFGQMEVGDGFDFPITTNCTITNIRSCTKNYIKNHNPTAEFIVGRLNITTGRCVRTA